MVEKRKKMHREIMDRLYQQNDQNILKNFIPYAVDVENMGNYRSPIFLYPCKSDAPHSFSQLRIEIKNRLVI